MNWQLLSGFLIILGVTTVAYVYFSPHHEAALKRLVLMMMHGLIGFWQIYLLG